MNKKIGYLFPGQGAQYQGMGKDFAASFPTARHTFEEADEWLEEKLSALIFEGPESQLVETRYSQLAIFVTSTAVLRVVQSQFPQLQPAVCSGLSLGEYTALAASGRLSFRETLFLVRERARFMDEACRKSPGTMAAVLGCSAEEIESVLAGCAHVWIANYNAPGQIVISGTKEGVEAASFRLKERGAKRIIPLAVHGAFHSPLMSFAQERLAPFIAEVNVRPSSIGFVMNVPGDFVVSEGEIKKYLTQQVTCSVRWEQGIRAMRSMDLFIEMGCGKTLTALNKKMETAPTLSIDKVADLEKIGKELCNC